MIDLYEDLDSAFSALYDYATVTGGRNIKIVENDNTVGYRYQSVDGKVMMELSPDCFVSTITIGDEFRVIRNLDNAVCFEIVVGDEKSFIEFASVLVPNPESRWYLTCDKCGNRKSSVSMIHDPFELDMNNREVVLATLCSDCFDNDYSLQQELRDLAMEV